jgi:hypothetical protein
MEGLWTGHSQVPKKVVVLQRLISHSPPATSTIPPQYPQTAQLRFPVFAHYGAPPANYENPPGPPFAKGGRGDLERIW